MRCDLHVHTDRSGMCTVPLARRFCQESYNDPMEVYWVLKRRGMDLVTVTDHDSIDAVECLRHYPDFFLSEEVTCTLPSGTGVHVGVYDITERDHTEIQRRRADVPSLAGYLWQRGLLFAVNHVFSALTGRRTVADFALFQDFFPGRGDAQRPASGSLQSGSGNAFDALAKNPPGGQRFAHPGRAGTCVHGGARGPHQARIPRNCESRQGACPWPVGRLLAVDPGHLAHRTACAGPASLGLSAGTAGCPDSVRNSG